MVEATRVPAHLLLPEPLQAKQLRHLQTQLSLGQSCHRQKSIVPIRAGSLRLCLIICDPVDCRLLGFSVREGGSPSKNPGVYCPIPGASRTPATQAAVPPPHLALTGANPSPPGQPQEQTPVDGPHTEVEIKPQLKPRGSVAKEEDSKPSHQLYKLQNEST